MLTAKEIERFESRICYEPNTGCWLWTGSTNGIGYGEMRLHDAKKYYAHRLSVVQFKGVLTKGKDVCHKCDTPSCVNPDHLFVGTTSDNMRDMVKKRRDNNKKKLSDHDVSVIKSKIYSGGYTRSEIAREYKVSPGLISMIMSGKRRKRV